MEEGEGINHFPLCLWVLLSSCVHRIDNSVRRHQDAAKRPESGLTCAMFLVTAEYPFQKTLQCCDIVAMSLFFISVLSFPRTSPIEKISRA